MLSVDRGRKSRRENPDKVCRKLLNHRRSEDWVLQADNRPHDGNDLRLPARGRARRRDRSGGRDRNCRRDERGQHGRGSALVFHLCRDPRTGSIPCCPADLPRVSAGFQAFFSRPSARKIASDHAQVFTGGFESLFSIMVRNKSGVIIKGGIALPTETIKDDQQTSMFLVDT